jgi:uncharacterized protein (DUF1697 family)
MADLKHLCIEAGFDQVETYIASGNVVFESTDKGAKVKSELQRRLHGRVEFTQLRKRVI